MSYTVSEDSESICGVDPNTGALMINGVGACAVTATAEGSANYNEASVTVTVMVQSTGNLVLNVDGVAVGDTINIAEKAAGFAISGNTGSEAGVDVMVQIGTETLTDTSADADPATWSVDVPGDASYITGTSVDVTVSATKTGYTSPPNVEHPLSVDLIAPTAPSYTAPSLLQVGVPITDMSPIDGSDIDEYSAPGLPSGLDIDTGSGVITGTPATADASATVTVTVTDEAGNIDTVDIVFLAVAKGDQRLTGFAYSASSVTFGSTAPTVTEPTGAMTPLSYTLSEDSESLCSVDPNTGALTDLAVGACVVIVTAEGTANYNEASATFTVTVSSAGNLVLNVNLITTDNIINIAEHTDGFAISGDTGSEAGVAVTVTLGGTSLPAATSADVAGTATWSVPVPGDASYIKDTSVALEVTASKAGFTSAPPVERSLTVDLSAPAGTAYPVPALLQVGETITTMSPSGGAADIDGYEASGLPSGLDIDTATGAIDGTPAAASDAERHGDGDGDR